MIRVVRWFLINPVYGARMFVLPMEFAINQALYIGIISEFIHSIESDPDISDDHKKNFILLQDGHQCYLPDFHFHFQFRTLSLNCLNHNLWVMTKIYKYIRWFWWCISLIKCCWSQGQVRHGLFDIKTWTRSFMGTA